MTNLAALEKKIRLLEGIFLSRSTDCCCRPGGETNYHTATELEQIMNVGCPIHPFRDLGDICWVPTGTPLLPQDRNFCACPPSLTRDLLAGSIGCLTPEENEKECGKWREEFTQKAGQETKPPAGVTDPTKLRRNNKGITAECRVEAANFAAWLA